MCLTANKYRLAVRKSISINYCVEDACGDYNSGVQLQSNASISLGIIRKISHSNHKSERFVLVERFLTSLTFFLLDYID